MTAAGTARARSIIGFLVAGSLLLAISFYLDRRQSAGRDGGVPPLFILEPATGDTVRNPVVLRFRTPARLRRDPERGWLARDLHLHAMVDSVEVMPAAADIAAGDSVFSWTLPPLEPGPRRIYLTWAGRHHGNLAGRTDTVVVQVVH